MADEEVRNDPPAPDLVDVEQRPGVDYGAVPVKIVGPVLTQAQPARTGIIDLEYLTSTPRQVAAADPRRQSITLVSDTAFRIGTKAANCRAPIPANLAITMLHASEVWAASDTPETELTVIIEMYAQ